MDREAAIRDRRDIISALIAVAALIRDARAALSEGEG